MWSYRYVTQNDTGTMFNFRVLSVLLDGINERGVNSKNHHSSSPMCPVSRITAEKRCGCEHFPGWTVARTRSTHPQRVRDTI